MNDNIQQPIAAKKHIITIEDRKNMKIGGISEVISYDPTAIVARCDLGDVVIQGEELKINTFDQQSGNLSLEGTVDAVQYINTKQKSNSFFARLMK